MKYASTALIDGVETIVCTLPLADVPLFDPENPLPGTYVVPDAVAKGWQKQSGGGFAPPAPVTPTLDQLKAAKNAEINAARAAANSRTFMHDGREFACDALSRSDIDGINGYVALNGTFPELFPTVWKAVDNTYYQLPDITAWKAFYASMVATGAANFAHAQDLKAMLATATTTEQVDAIIW